MRRFSVRRRQPSSRFVNAQQASKSAAVTPKGRSELLPQLPQQRRGLGSCLERLTVVRTRKCDVRDRNREKGAQRRPAVADLVYEQLLGRQRAHHFLVPGDEARLRPRRILRASFEQTLVEGIPEVVREPRQLTQVG